MLQPGRRQVAAGYVIYGSSTMMVYTTGQGVHGFTLDPSIGEFLLSHPNIRIPETGRYLSVNDSYEQLWDEGVRTIMRTYQRTRRRTTRRSARATSARSSPTSTATCSAAASSRIRRTRRSPKGKLRLLYEANPLAFIVEQAGGAASRRHPARPRRARRPSCTSARRSTSAARARSSSRGRRCRRASWRPL